VAANNAVRLAGMMFLQYGGFGAWVVPLARWLRQSPELGGLGFSPGETTWIYSTVALGGLFAPLFTGVLADRTFASEKLIAGLNGLMALLCLAAGAWCQKHSGAEANPALAFGPLFALMLLYSMAVMIGITTGTAMTLRTLADPARQFGRVRLVGTFGWVVAVAAAGGVFNPLSSDPFFIAAICHSTLATGFRWLPHTPPLGQGKPLAEVIGLPAIKLFRDPSFIVFVAVAFTVNTMQQFYTVFAVTCCADLAMEKPEVLMTSSQWVEMACMALIPFMVRAAGLKATMAIGLIGWSARNVIFMSESLPWVTWLGVPLQGLAYTWFTIVGSLYIDREAPPHLRAGAQGLLTFFCSGPGNLLGNIMTGRVVEENTADGHTDWSAVWLVPAVGCSIASVAFLLRFREPKRTS
jgi:nucleoside transporter